MPPADRRRFRQPGRRSECRRRPPFRRIRRSWDRLRAAWPWGRSAIRTVPNPTPAGGCRTTACARRWSDLSGAVRPPAPSRPSASTATSCRSCRRPVRPRRRGAGDRDRGPGSSESCCPTGKGRRPGRSSREKPVPARPPAGACRSTRSAGFARRSRDTRAHRWRDPTPRSSRAGW